MRDRAERSDAPPELLEELQLLRTWRKEAEALLREVLREEDMLGSVTERKLRAFLGDRKGNAP